MRMLLAVLGDSLALLRARRLFWISLGISLLLALVYLSIGFGEDGFSIMFGAFSFKSKMFAKGSPGAEYLYTTLFSTYILGLWLTWGSNILALISCAPIFPEFMLEGAAGVTLSKPISRWALFLYKYLGGLLFALVQTAIFVVIVVIAIRWRLGFWSLSIFWAVPLVTLVFSYLFAIQTFIGVLSRSVMLSILGAISLWGIIAIAITFEGVAYSVANGKTNPFSGKEMAESDRATWKTINTWMQVTVAVLPKTSETTGLLDRLIVMKSGKTVQEQSQENDEDRGRDSSVVVRHSKGFIIGTSLGFEAVVLALAAWSFKRRDF